MRLVSRSGSWHRGGRTASAAAHGFADLVVSRNSLFEWPDKMAGLREAYRILKHGGVAYMGGGFPRLMDPAALRPLVESAQRKPAQNPASWVEMDPQSSLGCRVGITKVADRGAPRVSTGGWRSGSSCRRRSRR